MQNQLERRTAAGRLQARLQLTGRRLTQAEERYLLSWLDMGFSEDAIVLAYEKTCLNTGGMKSVSYTHLDVYKRQDPGWW